MVRPSRRVWCWLAVAQSAAGAAEQLGPPSPASALTALPAAAGAVAQDPPAQAPLNEWFAGRPRVDGVVSAADAVRLALEHSPILAAMTQDVEMARQMLAMARARSAPMLAANLWATYGDGAMIVPSAAGLEPPGSRLVPAGASLDANFMAMLPLFTGGRLDAQARAERGRLTATEQDLATMRLDMALQVLTMVRRLTTMRGMIEVAREQVATNEERLRLDRAAHAAGQRPLANVLRNEAELAAARQQFANQQRDYRLMLADLKTMLGVHPLSAIDIGATAEAPTPSAAATDDAARLQAEIEAALRLRPELAGARARLVAAGHDLRAADAASGPQVGLFGMADVFANRMNDMDRFEEYTVGVVVSVPLADGGMRAAQSRRARAERARLTAVEQDAALRIAAEVSQAHERLAAAWLNVATARAALTAAREDYRLMQTRYQEGLAVNAEVLDALRMRTMAEVNALTAELDWAVAEDQRRRAVGDPGLLEPAP